MRLRMRGSSSALRRARSGRARVLIYSHDTFGLGHLRRSRAIANAHRRGPSRRLGGDHLGLAGHRQFRVRQRRRLRPHSRRHQAAGRRLPQPQPQRVDSTRRSGCARPSSCRPPRCFRPDLFIVDKEPTGFRGEVAAGPRLSAAARMPPRARHPRRHGRAGAARTEWERKGAARGAAPLLRRDLGLRPQASLRAADGPRPAGAMSRRRITYTGYLRRDVPRDPVADALPEDHASSPSSWSPPAAAATATT